MRLFTDLDSTIITTKKGEENIVPISKTPRGTSYIKETNLKKLQELSREIQIIPVTTRGIVSYNTINLGIDFSYALLDSGAILLVNGEIDIAWLGESEDIFQSEIELFEKGKSYLENQGFRSKTDSPFVIDYRLEVIDEEKQRIAFEGLKSLIGEKFDVFKAGNRGIFATHKELNKGKNLIRFQKEYGKDSMITAGDSEADWPMLKISDKSIGLTDSPATYQFNKDTFKENNYLFLDFVLDSIEKIKEGN